jgi:hypothetical protein
MRRKHALAASCAYYSIVNRLCFWGPRREAEWKRPVLLACAIVLAGGVGGLFWLFRNHEDLIAFCIFAAPLFAIGVFGAMVSVNGCKACVARMCGDLDIHI